MVSCQILRFICTSVAPSGSSYIIERCKYSLLATCWKGGIFGIDKPIYIYLFIYLFSFSLFFFVHCSFVFVFVIFFFGGIIFLFSCDFFYYCYYLFILISFLCFVLVGSDEVPWNRKRRIIHQKFCNN